MMFVNSLLEPDKLHSMTVHTIIAHFAQSSLAFRNFTFRIQSDEKH